ncbi:glutathione peroxidase [Kushneria aurantia]|uniref:Glutathione peroxidase n=1 Tax=Kushneria aurantia TaxID=504092 RepID=A0ABV6G7W4_9GAMM|nr:glutathione peroxidase [Kushneria aurantia]
MHIYQQDCRDCNGEPFNLRALRGQVLLVVNIATECRFTPQLAGLEKLYRAHRDQGFTVLGFPCNQFARQAPAPARDIEAWCRREYSVSFPLMARVRVNGSDADPLFRLLRRQAPGVLGSTPIKWNFTKFLVGRDGQVIARYGPSAGASALEAPIRRALDTHFSA